MALGALPAACSLVSNLDALDSDTDKTGGSSSSSTSSSSGAGGATCSHAEPPAPPASGDPGGAESFVVAVRSVDFSESSKVRVGYDLDKRCSCVEGASCIESTQHCDGPNGVDNAAASVFSLLQVGLDNFGSPAFTKAAESGVWSVLLRVSGYNGTPDDPVVAVEWYVSTGLVAAGDAGPPVPAWNGSDTWVISDESVKAPGNTPLFVDPKAYVSGGVLVAQLPGILMRVPAGSATVTFRFTTAVLTATIGTQAAAGAAPVLTGGLVGARWKQEDIFATVSSYRDKQGDPVCSDSQGFIFAKSQICPAQDILAVPGPDTTACDSISIGMAFETFPAKLGSVVPAPVPTPGCPAGTDPATQVCPM